jgi:hypothetical protein
VRFRLVERFSRPGGNDGPDIGWMYREAGAYIGQILKGAKPAVMPVRTRHVAR